MKMKSSTPFRDHRRSLLAIAVALVLTAVGSRAGAEQSPRDVVQSVSDQLNPRDQQESPR